MLRRSVKILLGAGLLLSGAVLPSAWDSALPAVASYPREPSLPPHPWIALTFDDGPHPGYTERLLSILHEEQVTATFFVVGKMVAKSPALVQEIAREGHEIGNHSYTHSNLVRLPKQELFKELDQTRSEIAQWTHQGGWVYRPPGGNWDRSMESATKEAGYYMMLWTVLTGDVQGISAERIYGRVLKQATDNGVVLMHSGVEATLEVLPQLIQELRNRGYHFVTVSSILGLPSPVRPVPPLQLAQADTSHAPSLRGE